MSKVYFCEMYLKINSAGKERKVRGTLGIGNILLGMCGFRPEFTTAGPSFLWLEFPIKSFFVCTDGPGQCHACIRLQRADLWRQECRSAVCQSWCSNIYCGWCAIVESRWIFTLTCQNRVNRHNMLLAFHHSTRNLSACEYGSKKEQINA